MGKESKGSDAGSKVYKVCQREMSGEKSTYNVKWKKQTSKCKKTWLYGINRETGEWGMKQKSVDYISV